MVNYSAYAEKFGWLPEQVDRLTIEQDDWLMPIIHAVEDERNYRQQKAQDAADRKAKAKTSRGYQ